MVAGGGEKGEGGLDGFRRELDWSLLLLPCEHMLFLCCHCGVLCGFWLFPHYAV
jgi:hypothetical protein